MLLATFALCSRPMASADTWWHLATGRWIAQNRAVPHTDPFSYTYSGRPWIAHEYLSDLMMYWIHRIGGFPALMLVNAALLTLAFGMLYQRAGGSRWMRASAVVLGVCAARPGFAIRPLTLTILMGSAFLWIAHRYLRDGRAWSLLWLPVLTILWVQLHAGYMLGIGLLLATIFAEMTDSIAGRSSATWRQLCILLGATAACVAVVPLNPNGTEMLRYPFEVLGMQVNRYIVEWQAPPLQFPRYYPFVALAVLTLVAMMASRKAYRPGQFLIYSAFLAAALKSGRNIPLFVLIAVPLLAEHARFDWGGKLAAKTKLVRIGATAKAALAGALVLACALVCAGQVMAGLRFQREAEHEMFPEAAVDYLLQHGLRPRMLNDYAYGGYLIWRLFPEHPEYKVYVDGRADLYGDTFLLAYNQIYLGQENPNALLEREHIQTVLLSPGAGLSGVFRIKTGNKSWRIAYEDRQAVIFASGE
jgi:hypothetical protein